jgi:hypothetical protein
MAARPEIRYEQERMIDMLARLRAAWPAVRRQEQAFNMRALWRLALWGSTATLALTLAVLAGFSEAGSRRLMAATPAPPSARTSDSEAQTRRLAEMVHILAADRERLVGRIDTLERNLEDMTGSIKRQVAGALETAAASPPPAALATVPPAPAVAPPAIKEAALAPPAEASAAAAPAAAPVATEAQPAAGERDAANPADATVGPPLELVPIRAEYGVDVGGAVSFDGLRVLWASTKENHAVLLDGLYPVVAVRESAKTKTPELRLIAGPLTSTEAALRICAKLSAARRYCQPVAFEGQRLAQADVVPERKPGGAASKPAPTPKPKPPPRSSSFFR